MRRHLSLFLGSLVIGLALLIAPAAGWAHPFSAQQNYDSPREATGKIVCANCHLAKKLTQAEVPQSVLPDSVFTPASRFLTKRACRRSVRTAAMWACRWAPL